MAYKYEKDTEDIVINGFEKGIAPSPHLGIGNLQNINITTEPGEASVNYARTAEDQQPIASGTFAADTSTRVDYQGSPALILGTWVTITASSISGLSTGTYCVVNINGIQYQLSTTISLSDIVIRYGCEVRLKYI